MNHLRCIACESAHNVTLYQGDAWCAYCVTEGKRDAYIEAAAMCAAILASRARHAHDVKAGSR